MEDIFQGDRTVEELTNFVFETVDPSRVSSDDLDTMLLMQSLMGGGGEETGEEEEEDLDYEDEETDDEEFAEDYEFEEEEEEEDEEDEDTEDGEVTGEEMEHIKKMITNEKERVEEQIQSGGMDIREDFDDFDADEDAMLFAEGDTEEEMSEDWLRRMVELDEKKKKKTQGTNSKELNDDKKNAEISEES